MSDNFSLLSPVRYTVSATKILHTENEKLQINAIRKSVEETIAMITTDAKKKEQEHLVDQRRIDLLWKYLKY